MIIWILGGLIVNAVIGAGVCASLDTDDQVFYNWYKEDPSGGLIPFLVLEFWFVMAILMWRYRRDMKRDLVSGDTATKYDCPESCNKCSDD